MAGQLPGNPSKDMIAREAPSVHPPKKPHSLTHKWYFSQEEIEDHSPSRRDGIKYEEASELRKLYCSFLQELGMELKVPQVTIATAMMMCHRFYMHRSHAKNDWQDVYDKQKELILIGERLLMSTIAYDLNIEHPYKPLVAALKKPEITKQELAKVAWNFVNDWLRTTLCLQYKPHYIAAGSMFLDAKFEKVKLPTEKGKV